MLDGSCVDCSSSWERKGEEKRRWAKGRRGERKSWITEEGKETLKASRDKGGCQRNLCCFFCCCCYCCWNNLLRYLKNLQFLVDFFFFFDGSRFGSEEKVEAGNKNGNGRARAHQILWDGTDREELVPAWLIQSLKDGLWHVTEQKNELTSRLLASVFLITFGSSGWLLPGHRVNFLIPWSLSKGKN